MNEKITDVVEKVLYSEDDLKRRIAELGHKISADYEGRELTVLAVLSGSFIFAADLLRALETPALISFVYASSYGEGTVSSGDVHLHYGKGFEPAGKDILVVEDIVDTGRTLKKVRQRLYDDGAKDVKICTLLDKPERRVVEIEADYVGFTIPDEFVVGYGLDYAYKYRQFPFVGILKPEIYENK